MIEINLTQLEEKLQSIEEKQAAMFELLNSLHTAKNTQQKQSETETEILLTTKDICNLFKVTRQSIALWRKMGKIRAVRVNKAVRYRQSEINELLNIRSSKV